jgi:hypothetical protein
MYSHTCIICDGNFVSRTRKLEKRCPACRLLGLTKTNKLLSIVDEITVKHNRSIIDLKDLNKSYVLNNNNVFENQFYSFDTPLWVERETLRSLVDLALSHLNEREQAVVRLRYGLLNDESDRTLYDVGKELGCTTERIRQIEHSGIKKLKLPRISRILKEYEDFSYDEVYIEEV